LVRLPSWLFAVLAEFPLQIWLLTVSIVLFRKREAVAPMLVHAG
jgi:hypothetical protein